ncbi:Apm1p [Sugiyamaella lignohabitans]|uniref:Apm1p n=1 Tax=Sugiyamaella lignohabitans TaxID=796027 RepID=A0A161HFH7_9ASCO|nr:Apm1p [Sugiyamaella lignohabitans]ANB11281.1 Apm1p [Sugiyamaella lignohabitans]
MVASAIFFLDSKGQPLLWRNYRGDIPMSTVDNFPGLLIQAEDPAYWGNGQSSSLMSGGLAGGASSSLSGANTGLGGSAGPSSSLRIQGPCITYEGINYMYISVNNIYLLALSKKNSDAGVILLFLHNIVSVLKEYFKEVEEESIRDNFVIIYELLDEMMDFGHPQLTDAKILQEYITQESHELQNPSAPDIVTNAVSWRPENIYYKKNELFLDVNESLNVLLNSDGSIIRSEIVGKINVNAYLSGMPILKLGLNDAVRKDSQARRDSIAASADLGAEASSGTVAPNLAASKRARGKYVSMEDVQFHQCVELEQFEKDRTISFVPPDGKFELMSYRVKEFKAKPLFLAETKIDIRSRSRVLVSVKLKSQYRKRSAAENVEVIIPVPPDADSPRFKTSFGTVVYAPELNGIVWKLKNFAGGREVSMNAELQLSSVLDSEATGTSGGVTSFKTNQPVQIKFDIPYLAVSGLQVRYLKVTEPNLKYPSLPWVRYLTQSGDEYSIRLPSRK